MAETKMRKSWKHNEICDKIALNHIWFSAILSQISLCFHDLRIFVSAIFVSAIFSHTYVFIYNIYVMFEHGFEKVGSVVYK